MGEKLSAATRFLLEATFNYDDSDNRNFVVDGGFTQQDTIHLNSTTSEGGFGVVVIMEHSTPLRSRGILLLLSGHTWKTYFDHTVKL